MSHLDIKIGHPSHEAQPARRPGVVINTRKHLHSNILKIIFYIIFELKLCKSYSLNTEIHLHINNFLKNITVGRNK